MSAISLRAALLATALLAAPLAATAQIQPVAPGGDPVVARVDGAEIRFSDVTEAAQRLPEQFRGMPPQILFPLLIDQMVSEAVVTQAARKAGLQDTPEVRRQMARIEDQVIQQALIGRLEQARARVGRLDFSDALHRQVSSLCHAAGVEGVRADLVLLRAAAAHAAWLGQEQISDSDVEAVADLVLAHRRKAPPAETEGSAQQEQQQGQQQSPQDSADSWGALPPQAVPTLALSGARPLPKKKP